MKGVSILTALLLLVFSLIPMTFATEDETDVIDEDSDEFKINKAFECLEEKADDCSGLTIQEVAITILATPDNIFDDCVTQLETRKQSDHWGSGQTSIRDTALAILALQHAGKNTTASEKWLLEQEKVPDELKWYLQQDSNEAAKCSFAYDDELFKDIEIKANKQITEGAGSCLPLLGETGGYWLSVNKACYDKEFRITCDKDFIANLLYRGNSQTIYVLEGTQSAPAYDPISLRVKSKCFGGNSCDYEGTVWAALALSRAGHNIDDFIPYIIAMSDTYDNYLPEAFAHMLTDYEDYAAQLISKQNLGDYWRADNSKYGEYYDTALALLALKEYETSDQVSRARDWLLFSQGGNGCWRNDPMDTAMVLWALEGKPSKTISDTGDTVSTTYCSTAGYFCIPSDDCPPDEDLGENFFCGGISTTTTCCETENLKTCNELDGQVCMGDTFCANGIEKKSSDATKCCTGDCETRPQISECEENDYTCKTSCSETEESAFLDCDSGQVCCRKKTAAREEKSLWWIWLLLGLIFIALGVLAYIYREKLKEQWNKIKGKGGKGAKPKGGPRRPRIPPRGMPPGRMPPRRMPQKPGFPPVIRQRPPVSRMRSGVREDPAMKETFRKLRQIATR